jgi:ABC-type multidrug transport system ATPase subunit
LQQHDSFFSMLTTREAVDMAAFLQFPQLRKSKRDELVESSLDALGLKTVQHRPIGDRTTGSGGLSGGEKRRLSVALELLSKPGLFLADEPTTGLDSSQASKVVRLIAQLAKERHIPCMCTLHQPRASIWKMFDSFILLGPRGRVCYMGSRQNATQYFSGLGYNCPPETNPAEFFIDLVSVDTEDPIEAAEDEARIEALANAFALRMKKSSEMDLTPWPSNSIVVSSNGAVKPIRWVRRSLALLQRSWRQNIRNHKVNALRLGAAIGNSLLFAEIFGTVRGVPSTKSVADRVALLSFGVINMSMVRGAPCAVGKTFPKLSLFYHCVLVDGTHENN